MLNINHETIKTELVPALAKCENIMPLSIMPIYNSMPSLLTHIIEMLPIDVNKEELKKHTIERNIIVISFYRKDPDTPLVLFEPTPEDEIKVVIQSNGVMKLLYVKDKDTKIHYNYISKVMDFKEIPLIMEDPNLFELCNCGLNDQK